MNRPPNEAAESALISTARCASVSPRRRAHASTLSGTTKNAPASSALAVGADALHVDEPLASLDPVATPRIEDPFPGLTSRVTMVTVTPDRRQASRITDDGAFTLRGPDRAGELIEFAPTATIFVPPSDPRTLQYVSGRFG